MDEKDFVLRNNFGICPRCGKKLILVQSVYSAYTISPTAWITGRLSEMVQYKLLCKCGYKSDMKVTPAGLYPKKYKKELPEDGILKENPLGEKDDKNVKL